MSRLGFDASFEPNDLERLPPAVKEYPPGLPLLPLLAQENIEDMMQLPKEWAPAGAFLLKVQGKSMEGAHILDGDYVLVEKVKTAQNGDIVVALVEGTDSTLKRFYHEGENIRLQPSNAAMTPIIVPAQSVQLQGRVIGVLRKY